MRKHSAIYNIPLLVIFILLEVLTIGCGRRSEILCTLDLAEQLMDERADSALAILDTIDPTHLRTDEEHALYGLLYTQALAKNWLPLPPDTLIARSTAYYEEKGDRLRYAKSNYYQGRTYYKNADYTRSILCYLKTKVTAEQDSLFFWAGLGCRGMADVYEQTQNFADMKIYAEKSLKYFKKSGKIIYIDRAVIDYARALCYTQEYMASNNLLFELIEEKDSIKDVDLLNYAYAVIANNLNNQRMYSEALPWHEKIIKSARANADDSLRYAFNLLANFKIDQAQEILDKVSKRDSRVAHITKVYLTAEKGNFKEAYNEYHKYILNLDTLTIPASVANISGIIDEYYNYRLAVSRVEKEKNNIIHWLIFTLVLLLSSIIIYIFFRNNSRLKDTIKIHIDALDLLKKKIRRQKFLVTNTSELDKFHFAILEKGGQELFIYNDAKDAIKNLKKDVNQCLTKYIEEKQLLEYLHQILNERYDGVVDNLKRDIPTLKQADINLFILSVLNFTAKAIAGYLEVDDVDLVYGRKKRLKKKIKNLPEERRDLYLRFFTTD
ncbi:MAG: hypothetical protein HDS26_03300 [Bacteroides sp.]|nr:hypothetical protein [Bacteroides sp.]